MWTNPSQKSRQGSDPPPIQAMPAFWDFLDRQPLPKFAAQTFPPMFPRDTRSDQTKLSEFCTLERCLVLIIPAIFLQMSAIFL